MRSSLMLTMTANDGYSKTSYAPTAKQLPETQTNSISDQLQDESDIG